MHLAPKDLLPFALAFVGGWGGLGATIVWWQILDLLNTRRPPDDQLPVAILTRRDFVKHWPIPVWRHVRDFHRQFPESKLYYWYWGCVAWLYTFVVAAGVVMFTAPHE